MKIKLFALLMALVLALCCLVSCGGNNEGEKGTDTEQKSETGAIVGEDNTDEQDSADQTTVAPVTGGTMSVSCEMVDGKLLAKVSVVNNPGIAGFNLKLYFDNTKLLPTAVLDSELFFADYYASNIHEGPEIAATLDHVSAQYAQATNFTEDGVIAVWSFDVIGEALSEYSFTLDASDVTDQSLNDMVFEIVDGAVSVD